MQKEMTLLNCHKDNTKNWYHHVEEVIPADDADKEFCMTYDAMNEDGRTKTNQDSLCLAVLYDAS